MSDKLVNLLVNNRSNSKQFLAKLLFNNILKCKIFGIISMKPKITIEDIIKEANIFSKEISKISHNEIRGITDGKAVGTYLEHKFQNSLQTKFQIELGNSARGIDLPSSSINTDIKVTSIVQPQSSSPFKSARQKIYGLGYNLLLFVYEKDDQRKNNLKIVDCAYISKERTADYQTTKEILRIIDSDGNDDDISAFLIDRNLPVDEIQLSQLVSEIMKHKPTQGYLTISNALQWRLQYGRIVSLNKNQIQGVVKII